jgi:hypothetical protein
MGPEFKKTSWHEQAGWTTASKLKQLVFPPLTNTTKEGNDGTIGVGIGQWDVSRRDPG